jgi:hypothetical protein
MSNHSLMTADRSTHLKIAAIAVVAAIVVVAVGLRARIGDNSLTTRSETATAVVKAGKPVTSASSDNSPIR